MSRITERNPLDFTVQWDDDNPQNWQTLNHEPTDEDLDRLCKERGLWEPGQAYPYFTVWCEGTDVLSGGGPASGIME